MKGLVAEKRIICALNTTLFKFINYAERKDPVLVLVFRGPENYTFSILFFSSNDAATWPAAQMCMPNTGD
ncbi:hypothetical protein PC116_g17525 [Phytophthora cactorum]|uniref:Uncharacterized protein n=1 Tax=Phytophthora cactorum TaxID=29920 RepID=A0A8T1FP76_9STRA|nr:hypothetical protein PC115_g12808 [Phytophthora cactorum]KAG2976507.1 hypothetical protein PC118_g13377 [Phytophthora cactorum]KAG4234296.1 hypothetical protein PC116_g17525 [Phytophthora cactorum]